MCKTCSHLIVCIHAHRDIKGCAYYDKKPKQGEWYHWGSPFSDDSIADSIVCSVCKARFVEIKGELFNFCPNCGARMKEGDEK